MNTRSEADDRKSLARLGSQARAWWRQLQPAAGEGHGKGDRAALARLRRASPADAMSHEATIELFRDLGYGARDHHRLPRVATLACVLAHVREHAPSQSFAAAIGRASFGDADSAALKPIRFQALITAEGEEDVARAFRRALAVAGGGVDVADLSRLILGFESEEVRRRLTFDYFGAGRDAAAEPDESDPVAA
jgi:CRISPR system Cascade subunit CasB